MRVLHFGNLVLALYCYCGDKKNKKTGFFQITYFKENKNMAVEKILKPFVPNAPFFYSLKASENDKVF